LSRILRKMVKVGVISFSGVDLQVKVKGVATRPNIRGQPLPCGGGKKEQ